MLRNVCAQFDGANEKGSKSLDDLMPPWPATHVCQSWNRPTGRMVGRTDAAETTAARGRLELLEQSRQRATGASSEVVR